MEKSRRKSSCEEDGRAKSDSSAQRNRTETAHKSLCWVEYTLGGEPPRSAMDDERPNSDAGAAAPTTQASSVTEPGRRTRRRCSGPSDSRPRSTAPQPSKKAKSRTKMPSCGREVCGDKVPQGARGDGPPEEKRGGEAPEGESRDEAYPEGERRHEAPGGERRHEAPEGERRDEVPEGGGRVCSACKLPPAWTACGIRWKHWQGDDAVAAAVRVWARLSAEKEECDTLAKKGDFVPAKDNCLCNRQTCVFAQVTNRKRLDETGPTRRCAVCNTSKTLQWKPPGAFLLLLDRYFTSVHATCQDLHSSGGRLGADSWLCNSCYLDGYRRAGKFFKADKSTVEGYINLLELHSPPPTKGSLEFVDRVLLLYLLGKLKGGEPVYLPDAVEVMRSARQESGLRSINDEPLRQNALGLFKDVSRHVVEANHFSFDGKEVGDDGRRKAHYLMPSQFNPLYVAGLHQAVCRLEKAAERPSSREGGVGADDDSDAERLSDPELASVGTPEGGETEVACCVKVDVE